MSPWLHFFYLGTLDPFLLLFYCNFAEHLQEKPKLSYISIFFQTQTFWHKYTKGKKNQSWYGRHQPPTKSKTKKQNELNKKQTQRKKPKEAVPWSSWWLYSEEHWESDSNHVSIKEGQWSAWPCSGYGKSRQWCVLRKWDGSVHRRKVESN